MQEGQPATGELKPSPVNRPLLAAHASESPIKKPGHLRSKILFGLVFGVALSCLTIGVILTLEKRLTLNHVIIGDQLIDPSKPDNYIEQQLKDRVSSYKLTIQYPDNQTKTFTPQEFGVKFDFKASVSNVKSSLAQDKLSSRLQWWQERKFIMSTEVDKDMLAAFIDQYAQVTEKPYTSASLAVNKGEVAITPETTGHGHTLSDPTGSIIAAAGYLKGDPLVLQKRKIPAPVTAKQLEPIKDQVEEILQKTVSFELDGRLFKPDRATIGSWVEPISNTSKTATLEFNSGKILEYIDAVSKPYINLPRSQITMTEPDGSVAVLVRGRDGFDVKNKEKVAAEVAKEILGRNDVTKILAVDKAAFKSVNAQGYDKWLVANITTKQMYAYEKDRLIMGFPISAGAPATPTVLGEFKIRTKVRIQNMRGLNTDGSSYYQPDVEWTNYFYGDYAIHGNYWRPASWFGNINSSHGCIGLQNHDAKWVFEWAPVGTPVITHL